MKIRSLITLAALSALTAGSAFAQGPWGDDLAYAPTAELGASTLTRSQVRADLMAARTDGRLIQGGEIATPEPVLAALDAYGHELAVAASEARLRATASAQEWTSSEKLVNKLPLELMPVSMASDGAPPTLVLLVELDERGEPAIVEVMEIDAD